MSEFQEIVLALLLIAGLLTLVLWVNSKIAVLRSNNEQALTQTPVSSEDWKIDISEKLLKYFLEKESGEFTYGPVLWAEGGDAEDFGAELFSYFYEYSAGQADITGLVCCNCDQLDEADWFLCESDTCKCKDSNICNKTFEVVTGENKAVFPNQAYNVKIEVDPENAWICMSILNATGGTQ